MTSTVQDIKRQLDYINSSFVGDPDVSNVFLGKKANSMDNTNTFLTYLLTYANFEPAFLTNATAVNETLLNNIKLKCNKLTQSSVCVNNADWQPLNGATTNGSTNGTLIRPSATQAANYSIRNNNTTLETTHYITFKDIIASIQKNDPTDVGGSQPMNLSDMLNSFTAAYNFLDTNQFKAFKTNGSTTVIDYQGNSYEVANITLGAKPGNALINKVLNVEAISKDTTTARTDAIRRLFLGYIYLIEIYIAVYLNKNYTVANDYTAKNILETCIKKFIKLNESMYDTVTSKGIGNLYVGLEKRMNDYKTSKSALNSVAVNIDKTKTGITLEQNSINSHTHFLQNNQMAFYIYMSIFLIMVAVMLYIYYAPMSSSSKQKIMVGLTAISLVVLLLAYVTYKFVVVEPFAEQTGSIATKTGLYTDISLGVFNEYLTHTINVLRLLDTYRSYGEVSLSIRKENNYYTNVSEELKLNKGELNSVQTERLRQGKILRFRTYLFVQILITLSFLMLLLSYQYNILYIIIAAFVILFWVYLYVFNMNNLVRTDSKKFYWGQPNMS